MTCFHISIRSVGFRILSDVLRQARGFLSLRDPRELGEGGFPLPLKNCVTGVIGIANFNRSLKNIGICKVHLASRDHALNVAGDTGVTLSKASKSHIK